MPTRTPLSPAEITELGEATGKIAAYAAKALDHTYPHLDLEGLVAPFTRDGALELISVRYMAGIEQSKTPGEAAGDAGAALIRAWADARLAARARLAEQHTTRPGDTSTEPAVVRACETSAHDHKETRRLYADGWHCEQSPAVWGPPILRERASGQRPA